MTESPAPHPEGRRQPERRQSTSGEPIDTEPAREQTSREQTTPGKRTSGKPARRPRMPLRDRLVHDSTRTVLSLVLAMTLSMGVALTLTFTGNDRSDPSLNAWLGVMTAWLLITLVHTLLTWWAFARRTGEDLRRALNPRRQSRRLPKVSRTTRRWLVRMFVGRTDAPSWALNLALMSLVVMVAQLLIEQVRSDPVMLTLGFAIVVAAWVDVAVVHAEHYARLDVGAEPDSPHHLHVGGEDEPEFSDYVYLGFAVQTSFASPDVTTLPP